MKYILTSDTHKNGHAISKITHFAQENEIPIIFDAGDLHGEIKKYSGIELHAVYWDKAIDGMGKIHFHNEVESIGGTVHNNGTSFRLHNLLVFMQHNLAGYNKIIPQKELDRANHSLDQLAAQQPDTESLQRYILFGHTHESHFHKNGKSIAINPGDTGNQNSFVIIDTDAGNIVFRNIEEVFLTIDPDSNIVQVREFERGRGIASLCNGNEIYIYKEDGEEKRSEEFQKVISGKYFNFSKQFELQVKNFDDLQQIITPAFRSKPRKKVGTSFTNNSNGNDITAYIATVTREDTDQEILVRLQNSTELESTTFDKISTVSPIIQNNFFAFVGQTNICKGHSEHPTYNDSLVINDEIIATYSKIKRIDLINNNPDNPEFLIIAKTQGKEFIATIDSNREITEYPRYDSVRMPQLINGNIIYVVKEDLGRKTETFVVINNEEQTKHSYEKFDFDSEISLRQVTLIGNSLAYVVSGEEKDQLFFDGNITCTVLKKKYSISQGIQNLQEFNGKLAYIKTPKDQASQIIIGEETIIEKDKIHAFCFLNNQLIYHSNGKNKEIFIANGPVIDGYNSLAEIKKAYDSGELQL